MKELLRMSYKDVTFAGNPSSISITMKTSTASSGVLGKTEKVENIYQNASVVSGKGVFIGDNAVSCAKRLCALLCDKSKGMLYAPGIAPMYAYFTDFHYEICSTKNAVNYSFSFTECVEDKVSRLKQHSTNAFIGENAFDIANRVGKTVDDIMDKNNYPTPFDVKKGDEVKI